jgi:multiple sugar transport system permease protein
MIANGKSLSEGAEQLSARERRRRYKFSPGYLFIAPAVLYISVLVFFPTIRIAIMSVTETVRATGEIRFAGLNNFKSVLSDPVFRKATLQTFHWAFFTTLGHLTIGFALALAMNSTLVDQKIRSLCRALILLPWALTAVVVAILVQLWAHPMVSPVSKILQALGSKAEFLPLGTPSTAMWTLIGIQVWQFTPFFMLMILAGLQTLDSELLDAAKVDGASWWQRTVNVTIPHIRNLIITLALFDLVTLSASFDLIWIATNGGPVRRTEVLATYIYRSGFLGSHWNLASTAGMILLVLLILIALFMIRQMQDE